MKIPHPFWIGYALAFLFLQSCSPNRAMITLPIHSGWQFRKAGDTTWMPATVPGTVHTDLLNNGLIEDPFYRTNERDQQWIDKADWEYSTHFEVTPAVFHMKNIRLDFQGLDTYADVYLNDSLLLRADNFFRSWKVDAKPWLQEGRNELRIYFHSPIKIGLQKLEAHGYPLPASNDQSENGGMGDKRVSVFSRKPGYHYGWDWGPRLVTSGIWEGVELQAWDGLRVEDLYFQQISVTKEKAVLRARFEVRSDGDQTATFKVMDGKQMLASAQRDLSPGLQEITLDFEIEQPRLWWTKELGEPYLYQLRGLVETGDKHTSETSHAIGLRDIRIVQEPDSAGSSFYLALNGVPVFCKGANYIPNDVFIPRVSEAQYQNLIASAVAANMNMLRVWGGGFYEKDLFYELCDQNGILVWQDFMFACSMYPGDSAFLENVRLEAVDNVRRLRNHASIALWCGNNEIDVAWANFEESRGWGWKQQYNSGQRTEIWAAYDTVFHHILPEAVGAESPGSFYWPSSPYMGEGKHATYDSGAGDIHYWGVWHGEQPFSDFRKYIGRFMSEYGFQSFPEFSTVKKYTLPEDWNIESEVMAAHQRSGIGNLRIRSYMEQHFRVPERFEDQLYVGQLLQAEAIKEAIEAHRIAMPYCMGSLYWQINDCWPVASWSGMDYYQNWKALHYAVKNAFEPVLLAAQADSFSCKIYGISDLMAEKKARLLVEQLDFEGRVLAEWSREVVLPERASVLLDSIGLDVLRSKAPLSGSVLRLRLLEGEQELHSSLVWLLPPKDLDLPAEPGISLKLELGADQWLIAVRSEKLAKNVYLQWEDAEGFFSENYFDLLPGTVKKIRFTPNEKGQNPEEGKLKVSSLVEMY